MPTYEYDSSHTSPNSTPAAKCPSVFGYARKITSITIHWWGDPATGPSHSGVVSYLCRPGGSSSAHYVVSPGLVSCIVDPDDAAWHAGNSKGNATSIGLELDPRAQDGTYTTAAELIRELREAYGDVPLVKHSSWKSTACPGVYDLDRLDRLARVSGGGGASKPVAPSKPSKPSTSAPSKPTSSKNPALVKAIQKAVHVTADGVWGDDTDEATHNVRMASNFKGGKFPNGVKDTQRAVGTKADGVWGRNSRAAHDRTVAKIQRALGVADDGIWGPNTDRAFVLAWRSYRIK